MKSQIWIAVSVYVLIAIIKKTAAPGTEPLHNSTILSLTVFEKTPLEQLLTKTPTFFSPRIPLTN